MIKAGQKRKRPSAKSAINGIPEELRRALQEDYRQAVDYLKAQRNAFRSNKKKFGKTHPWNKVTWAGYLEDKFISENMNRRQAQRVNSNLRGTLDELRKRFNRRKAEAKR